MGGWGNAPDALTGALPQAPLQQRIDYVLALDSRLSTLDLPMNPQDAVDLAREAVVIAALVAAPVLIAGMLVGLIIGLVQALTQIQEQTVAFVPKLIAMAIALGLSLPWVLMRLVEYSRELISNIPGSL